VADDTGVVIIPQGVMKDVIRLAIEASKKEERLIQVIEEGSSVEDMKKVLAPEKW
jgi:regulator of RNase E activity RraA